MAKIAGHLGDDGVDESLSRRLTVVMRTELPTLITEIVDRIGEDISEYQEPLDGPHGHAILSGVRQAVSLFVEQIVDPAASSAARDETYRQLGRYECRQGRGLDTLQAACRIGARLSWRRIMRIGRHLRLPAEVMSHLAEAVFSYLDQLTALCAEGYRDEQTRLSTGGQRDRRLLDLLLGQRAVSNSDLQAIATSLRWPVPESAAIVAVQAADAAGSIPALPTGFRALYPAIIARLDGDHPRLLLPDSFPTGRHAELAILFPGRLVAVGPTVPLAQLRTSARWAHQALTLAESGTITDRPIVRCADHLSALLLSLDQFLIDQLAMQRLPWLRGLPSSQRQRLADTLLAVLSTQGTTPQIANLLKVHPQTVRYRMRQLKSVIGPDLADPRARFDMMLVLWSLHDRQHAKDDDQSL